MSTCVIHSAVSDETLGFFTLNPYNAASFREPEVAWPILSALNLSP
jgi:hypothetical protein